jgi:alpha/beta superfamily hydrolase
MSATIVTAQPEWRHAASSLRSLNLTCPAGRLEAVLNEGAPNAPFAALVCHPHPLGGGNLHNKVVYHAMKVLNDRRWGFAFPVLRFNFRGTGLSEGAHHGTAEAGDVLAALAWLEEKYRRPIIAAGFSFGAAMTIAACCAQEQSPSNVRALIALGLPIRNGASVYDYPSLEKCALPKLFLSGDHDQFAPAGLLQQIVASAAEPHQLVLIPGADHFFTGHLAAMQSSFAAWLKEQLQ